MKKTTIKKAFTLFEILLCMAILGLLTSLSSWGIGSLWIEYRFNEGVKAFIADLQKNQLIAQAAHADIVLTLSESKGHYAYQFTTDEPIKAFYSKKRRFNGVTKILSAPSCIPLYSSGRIGESPLEIQFLKNKKEGLSLRIKGRVATLNNFTYNGADQGEKNENYKS